MFPCTPSHSTPCFTICLSVCLQAELRKISHHVGGEYGAKGQDSLVTTIMLNQVIDKHEAQEEW